MRLCPGVLPAAGPDVLQTAACACGVNTQCTQAVTCNRWETFFGSAQITDISFGFLAIRQEPKRRRFSLPTQINLTYTHTHTRIVTLGKRRTWVLIRQHLPRHTHKQQLGREPELRECELERALGSALTCAAATTLLNAWAANSPQKKKQRQHNSSYDFRFTHTHIHRGITSRSNAEPNQAELSRTARHLPV